MRFVRHSILLVTAAAALVALPADAAAQAEYRNARRLGGSTSFYKPPLTNAASLKKMMARKGIVADLGNVLGQAGASEVTDRVIATLQSPTEVVRGGNCAEASPVDGTLVECDFAPGATLEWMAFRPKVKGKPTPSLLRNLRWAGKAPFKAFVFRVTTDDKIYTFVLPKPCANLSLASAQDIPKPPVQLTLDRRCVDYALQGRITATGDLSKVGKVRALLNGSPAGELTAPSWSLNVTAPGTYTFEATDKAGKPYPVGTKSLVVEACPARPEPPKPPPAPTCNLTLTAEPAKGGTDIVIAAAGSDPGATLAVEVYDPAGKLVGQKLSGPSNRVTVKKDGTYTVRGTVSGAGGSGTCEATIAIAKPPGPTVFFDGAIGKERRVRPVGDDDTVAGFGAGVRPVLGVAGPEDRRRQALPERLGARGHGWCRHPAVGRREGDGATHRGRGQQVPRERRLRRNGDLVLGPHSR